MLAYEFKVCLLEMLDKGILISREVDFISRHVIFFFFFGFLGQHQQHMEVPRLEV